MKINIDKWITYQEERFPLKQYLPMVFAFSFCAVSYSAVLRGASAHIISFVVAFITSLGFFMLLRVADEFKDYEEDKAFRAYRPVPRGLVQLRELRNIGIALVLLQGIAALLFMSKLFVLLIGVWAYFGLMTKEFFVSEWLRNKPVLYMVSHMMIMPLLDFYATACDWLSVEVSGMNLGHLVWFLVASFLNGAVIEIGRKIRRPEDEEHGVETYSVLWGMRNATIAWVASMTLSLGMALKAAQEIHILLPTSVVLVPVFCGALYWRIRFINANGKISGKAFELISGIWVLAMYLSLGGLPLVIQFITGGR